MTPNANDQLVAQLWLIERGHAIEDDGRFGPQSRQAARDELLILLPRDRAIALCIQRFARDRGIEFGALDAWFGPATDEASKQLQVELGIIKPLPTRPDESPDAGKDDETDAEKMGPVRCWRPTDEQMIRAYGEPGENQVTAVSPYPLRIAWNTDEILTEFACHEAAKDRFEAALRDVLDHYGIDRIRHLGLDLFGGCLNVRPKRGGSSWSAHAFGVAADWDPDRNRLREHRETARFARPEYDAWMDVWAANGFMSLGACYDFDWMHFQLNPS